MQSLAHPASLGLLTQMPQMQPPGQMPQMQMQTWMSPAPKRKGKSPKKSGDKNVTPTGSGSTKESVQRDDQTSLQEDHWSNSIPVQGPNVWMLSKDEKGCRRVQHELEKASCDEKRMPLVAELHSHVWEAMHCPHANFVIETCIKIMSPAKLEFIVDEISGRAVEAARHQYGCRILQRLFEHPPKHFPKLVEELLRSAVDLCTDHWGSYVMRQLLEHGAPSQAAALKSIMADNVSVISERKGRKDHWGCHVLCTALEQTNQDATIALACAFLQDPALLVRIADQRKGTDSVKLALQVEDATLAAKKQKALAALQGAERMFFLSNSRYGKALWKHLAEQHGWPKRYVSNSRCGRTLNRHLPQAQQYW